MGNSEEVCRQVCPRSKPAPALDERLVAGWSNHEGGSEPTVTQNVTNVENFKTCYLKSLDKTNDNSLPHI